MVNFTSCILPNYPPPDGGKTNSIIGSELTSLYTNFGTALDTSKTIFIIDNTTVKIEVIAKKGQFQAVLDSLINNYGFTNRIDNGPNSMIITGSFPIANLKKLDTNPISQLIDYCRRLFPPISNSNQLGLLYQGDSAMHSNFAKQGYNIAGTGVKVGVFLQS